MNATAFEALADENRLAIMRFLADGEHCLCEISERLGISNALASHHVKKLREAGLVDCRRKGVWLHCKLNDEALLTLAEDVRAMARAGSRQATASSACCVPAQGVEL